MSKKKKIGFSSFVLICIGLFVLAVQFSANQRLKALETNEDKNSLIELVMDSEELLKDNEFNLTVLVSPDVTKDIVLPIPEGLTFMTEQMESEDYQVTYDSTSRLMTIELSPIEEVESENNSDTEALVQNEAERKPLVIPLAFKVENTGEYTLEAKTIYQENSLSSNQVTFSVTETQEKLELETDEELEEPIIDAPTVDENAPTLLRSPKSAVANVGTWDEFGAAINDPSVSEINLTANIYQQSWNLTKLNILTRSLTINGNNFRLDLESKGIQLGIVPVETQLTVDNVKINKTVSAHIPIFNAVTGASGSGTNWVINISNVLTDEENESGLIGAVNATVILRETNNLHLRAATSQLNVKKLIFEENSIFKSRSRLANGIQPTTLSAIAITNGTILVKKNAKVSIINDGKSKEKAGKPVQSSSSAIAGSISNFTMESDSEVLTEANIYSYRTTIKNNFTMTGGAKFEAIGTANSIFVSAENVGKGAGVPATINISGARTSFILSSHRIGSSEDGAVIRIQGDGSVFNVTDDAEVNVTKRISYSKLKGSAPVVRMDGKDNHININTGGKFILHNTGSDGPNDGLGSSGNQGLLFTGGNGAVFNLKDAGSSAEIRANYGPAIVSTGSSKITAGEGTIFKMRGRTKSKAGALFNTTTSEITVDRPLFFDFRNDQYDGAKGSIFNATAGSTFTSIQSDLSVWPHETNLNASPAKNWSLFDYKLSGANFTKIDSTNVPNEFNTGANSFGSTGASAYSRMTGGKVRAVVDELRVPTNADKSIFGHVTIPLDGENGRDAFTDEAFVVVKLTKANGKSQELTGRTIGKNNNNLGLSVYGEASRGGMFKIPVPNDVFLETGDKIEVVRAWRGGADSNSNRVHHSLPEDLVAPNRTTFDITPPNPAVITNSRVVDNATKQISGKANEPGSEVEISVNGVDLATTTTVQPNGTFVFNLPHYLEKDDLVQVKLRDHAGLASTVGVDHPPSTNNAVGNGNPTTNLTFHDQVFMAAPSVIVKDVLPDTNKAVKSVVVDNSKNATQIGSILTYTIDVENNKPAAIATNWKAVTIEDQLDKALDPDLNSFALNGILIPATKVEFNEETRLLKVKVGDLGSNKKVKLTFNTRVNKTGINRTIFNKATIIGNSPREVEPFKVGPENPTAAKQKIQTISNKIANPGGPVFGVLELVSTPTTISFGEDLKIAPTKQRYPVTEMSGGLTVQDSRAVKASWSITARMTSILESAEGKKLPNAMHYTYNGIDQILGTDSIVVYQHTSTNEDPLSISDSWNVQEGLNLQIPAGRVYPGRYRGTIEWTLQDTPETK
ncbi:isopeptide-forming domain-containing fimbrial protein [Carnobacterium maltaromaticum]|uniref:isopeptide-forming domain-containing fimbrial protein n=1 Tax=Carnobacterium maltaromaticum TaxID=2751 RepID=UPI00298A2E2D|nr:isopeptide-forming domain-containing fimbrial protein [Carnobacterium maltaromaticum]MDW5523736.1 isopeptide-forming domain-containing fimbrial protein [Carnobacterium maltaromaticum]